MAMDELFLSSSLSWLLLRIFWFSNGKHYTARNCTYSLRRHRAQPHQNSANRFSYPQPPGEPGLILLPLTPHPLNLFTPFNPSLTLLTSSSNLLNPQTLLTPPPSHSLPLHSLLFPHHSSRIVGMGVYAGKHDVRMWDIGGGVKLMLS